MLTLTLIVQKRIIAQQSAYGELVSDKGLQFAAVARQQMQIAVLARSGTRFRA